MFHATLTELTHETYPIVFLVPSLRRDDIKREYVDPFNIPHDDVMILSLHYSQLKKKTPAEEMKAYIRQEVVPILQSMETKYIVVTDSEYFKILTKSPKVDVYLGYVLDCIFGPWKVVYAPNHKAIFYDPIKVRAKINQGMTALVQHISGTYQPPGNGIIEYEAYPKTTTEIKEWLDMLLAMDCDLTIDIEAFSLKHHKAGIGTITFCWSKTKGIAFPVDYQEIPNATAAPYGINVRNEEVRELLKDFFNNFKRRAIYHNVSYDVYVLIYQLYMDNIIDTEGLLNGMDILLSNWEDTKLITYLATNSCAGNKLSLKDQAQEYAGNYAESEIVDITRIPLDNLLRYNLVDGLSTWFVYGKHWDTLITDNQMDLYTGLFKDAIVDIIQMQLTGLPISMPRVIEVKSQLKEEETNALQTINNSNVVKRFTYKLNEDWVLWKNSTLKKKRVTLADAKEVFNPNSGPQLQKLLYSMLGLPVLAYTDAKQPSTDGDTLRDLLNHTGDVDIRAFLEAMLTYSAVNKILTSFIPAFEDAALGPDGWHYLFGSFNLGGTLSGRLSSSNPNLQNLPATNAKMVINVKISKLIKSCFQAPPGWIFAGLDFASLEDKISALTTKDPNKLKVYLDGYDGHSLRAYAYFEEDMPAIRMSAGKRAFTITQGGVTTYLLEDDTVTLADGTVIKVQDYL